MSNGLDPDQDRHFVGPDQGQNCCKDYQPDDKCTRKMNCHGGALESDGI